eukprot:2690267-Lingulodinium_polyedra.AAC.1
MWRPQCQPPNLLAPWRSGAPLRPPSQRPLPPKQTRTRPSPSRTSSPRPWPPTASQGPASGAGHLRHPAPRPSKRPSGGQARPPC